MSTVTDSVLDEAMSLPVEARLDLIQKLIASLNLPTRPDIDREWADEAERRVAEVDRGEVELIPGEAVFARIRQKHQR